MPVNLNSGRAIIYNAYQDEKLKKLLMSGIRTYNLQKGSIEEKLKYIVEPLILKDGKSAENIQKAIAYLQSKVEKTVKKQAKGQDEDQLAKLFKKILEGKFKKERKNGGIGPQNIEKNVEPPASKEIADKDPVLEKPAELNAKKDNAADSPKFRGMKIVTNTLFYEYDLTFLKKISDTMKKYEQEAHVGDKNKFNDLAGAFVKENDPQREQNINAIIAYFDDCYNNKILEKEFNVFHQAVERLTKSMEERKAREAKNLAGREELLKEDIKKQNQAKDKAAPPVLDDVGGIEKGLEEEFSPEEQEFILASLNDQPKKENPIKNNAAAVNKDLPAKAVAKKAEAEKPENNPPKPAGNEKAVEKKKIQIIPKDPIDADLEKVEQPKENNKKKDEKKSAFRKLVSGISNCFSSIIQWFKNLFSKKEKQKI